MRQAATARRRPTIFHLFFALPCLVLLARWLWPLALPLWPKLLLAVLFLCASQFHLWNRLSSGSVFDPDYPRSLVILFNWAFGAILLLAALQILLDVATLAASLMRGQLRPAPDEARYLIAGIAAVLAAVGVAGALRVPPVRDVEVRIPGLAREFDGYRLLQLTDLHISRLFPASWASRVVDRANGTGVDLIVVTGDFIDGRVERRRDEVEPLRRLSAPDGLYAVPGNHEYYFGYREWMTHLGGMGFRMLPNAHVLLRRGGARLAIAGVTERAARQVGEEPPNLGTALGGIPPATPVILLDHQPRGAARAASRAVALQLSGHTHGGMILGLDRIVASSNGGYVSGRYQVGPMTLYVSNGTGLWPGFALRLGRPPEMTRFTLRSDQRRAARPSGPSRPDSGTPMRQ